MSDGAQRKIRYDKRMRGIGVAVAFLVSCSASHRPNGDDATFSNPSNETTESATNVVCPTAGSVGAAVGQVVRPGSIPLADGSSYSIESSCGKPVYMLGVTETCSICMEHLGRWTRFGGFLDQLKADGAEIVLISTDNPQGENGSAKSAEGLRKRFQLGDRFVLGYEPLGRDSAASFIARRTGYAGARIALIVRADGVIGAVGQVDSESEIRAALAVRAR